MQPVVLKDPIEVVDALAELGLSWDVLREAMLGGEGERDECTANDPPGAPGFFSYARTTRRLGELLIPSGWTRQDKENLALVVSPSRDIAIAVSTGDEGTGVHYLPARSKYPKGPATVTAVEQNRQLLLFHNESQKTTPPAAWRTWLLLRRRVGNKLYCELSLPYSVGEDDRVEEWTRRIIFDPISFEPSINDGDDTGDPIVINVPRRP